MSAWFANWSWSNFWHAHRVPGLIQGIGRPTVKQKKVLHCCICHFSDGFSLRFVERQLFYHVRWDVLQLRGQESLPVMHPKDRQHALSWYAHRVSRVGPNILGSRCISLKKIVAISLKNITMGIVLFLGNYSNAVHKYLSKSWKQNFLKKIFSQPEVMI